MLARGKTLDECIVGRTGQRRCAEGGTTGGRIVRGRPKCRPKPAGAGAIIGVLKQRPQRRGAEIERAVKRVRDRDRRVVERYAALLRGGGGQFERWAQHFDEARRPPPR